MLEVYVWGLICATRQNRAGQAGGAAPPQKMGVSRGGVCSVRPDSLYDWERRDEEGA